jgi:hypothetical protein
MIAPTVKEVKTFFFVPNNDYFVTLGSYISPMLYSGVASNGMKLMRVC